MIACAAVVLAYMLVVAAVIGRDLLPGHRATFDQELYHKLVVKSFAQQWPNLDLHDYRSATTPGYHAVLAGLSKFIGLGTTALRLEGSLFTLGLLVTLAWNLAKRRSPWSAAALMLPLACSLYIFGPACWLLPDNAAWWPVLALFVLALDRPANARTLAIGGTVLVGLVLARQIHVWAASLLWISAWLGAGGRLFSGEPIVRRAGRAALALAFTLPAFVTLEYFVRLWHGPVPPMFQGGAFDPVRNKTAPNTTGGNPATPAFLLTVFACYAPFFAAYFWPTVRQFFGRTPRVVVAVLIGAAVGLVLGVAPTTFPSFDAGRYSGFWAIAEKLPSIAGRSSFIAAGSVAGGAVLGLLWSAVPRRDGWILLAGAVSFAASQAATHYAWQRYLEPFVLIVLTLAAARTGVAPTNTPNVPSLSRAVVAGRVLGPAALGAILAAIAFNELRQAPENMTPATAPAEPAAVSKPTLDQ